MKNRLANKIILLNIMNSYIFKEFLFNILIIFKIKKF